jgi:hypothetical protein
MARYRKSAKHPVIAHGLSSHLEKWKHDGRLKYVKALRAAREGLYELFPQGVNAGAALLIDRVVYKALKLSIFEAMDLKGAALDAGAQQRYLLMANSLREDLRLLNALAQKQTPEKQIPSLERYLAGLKEAGQSAGDSRGEKEP